MTTKKAKAIVSQMSPQEVAYRLSPKKTRPHITPKGMRVAKRTTREVYDDLLETITRKQIFTNLT